MTRRPNVAIRIERVVVDAASVGSHDASRVQAAIEAELARLLSEPVTSIAGGATRSVSVTNPRVDNASTPALVGREIARSIHAVVTGAR
jgi:hypothetical protein